MDCPQPGQMKFTFEVGPLFSLPVYLSCMLAVVNCNTLQILKVDRQVRF